MVAQGKYGTPPHRLWGTSLCPSSLLHFSQRDDLLAGYTLSSEGLDNAVGKCERSRDDQSRVLPGEDRPGPGSATRGMSPAFDARPRLPLVLAPIPARSGTPASPTPPHHTESRGGDPLEPRNSDSSRDRRLVENKMSEVSGLSRGITQTAPCSNHF